MGSASKEALRCTPVRPGLLPSTASRWLLGDSGAQGECRNLRPRLETPACAKRLKPVADTEDGFYVLRAVRAQLFSQPANMYV